MSKKEELKRRHKILQKAYRNLIEYLMDCFDNRKPILSKEIFKIHDKLAKRYSKKSK